MRGKQVSRTARKEIDVVLIAARMQPESTRISMAQGCQRRGTVWGDVQLLERASIIDLVHAGKRVVTGRQLDLQGDFEVFAPVQINQSGDEERLSAGESPGTNEDLGIPLF